jgi:hypothetical protein
LAGLGITVGHPNKVDAYTRILNLTVNSSAVVILILSLILASVFVGVINELYRRCPVVNADTVCTDLCNCDQFRKFMRVLGGFTGVIYTVVTLLLIASYVYLRKAMATKAYRLVDFSVDVNRLYFSLVAVFTVQTVYLYFQGDYHALIKNQVARVSLEIVCQGLFNCVIITTILMLHTKNFKRYLAST